MDFLNFGGEGFELYDLCGIDASNKDELNDLIINLVLDGKLEELSDMKELALMLGTEVLSEIESNSKEIISIVEQFNQGEIDEIMLRENLPIIINKKK